MIIRFNWKSLILSLFLISVIFPSGFGLRLSTSIPGLDIQRLSIILIFLLFPIYYFKRQFITRKFLIHTKIQILLLFIILINFISIISVESPLGSLLWAFGNTFLFFGYAFIILFILTNERVDLLEITKVGSIISIILILWVLLEMILQSNIITYRNMYKKEVVDIFSNITRIWVMPIGPFVYVKALAMALILFGPMAYVHKKQLNEKYGLVWFILFVLAIIATQTFSAILSLFIMFVLYTRYYKKNIFIYMLFSLIVFLITLYLAYIFFPEINNTPNSKVANSAIEYYSQYYLPVTINHRMSSIETLFFNWLDSLRWLFGWGNGSLGDSDRVASSIFDTFDKSSIFPGSIFNFFIESGIFVGLLILLVFTRAIIIGLYSKNNAVIMMAISLSGFFIMMFSTTNTKLFGPALVMAGLTEYFSKKRTLNP